MLPHFEDTSNNKKSAFFLGGKEKNIYISTSLSVDVIYWIYHCYVR